MLLHYKKEVRLDFHRVRIFSLFSFVWVLVMQASMAEYHALRLRLAQLEKQMMGEVLQPERVLLFMKPGRLVRLYICVSP